jgi:Tol biopolymer transport system component
MRRRASEAGLGLRLSGFGHSQRAVAARAGSLVRVLGAVAVATALALLPSSAEAAFSGVNGKVAFVSSRDGNYEIYSMNADGSGQTNLANNAAADLAPAWSPDGTKIAFTSFRDGNAEIYTMNADGTGQTRLTNNTAIDSNPTWSPDSSEILFRSDRDAGDYEIYSMNANGAGQTNLTNSPGVDDAPAWSPDGSKIAFETVRDGNYEIYSMNPDGTGQTDLTNDPDVDRGPAWSPTGSNIAFDTTRDGNYEVYSMNPAGTGQTDLTTNTGDDSEPAWSPDGTKIAFRSQRDGNGEIYSMNAANGSGQTRLTSNTAYDSRPNWQPVIPGFARPKGATPLRAALVIAYAPCSSPNRTHGAPLINPSCNPPVQASSNLTVGTLDANGATPAFTGLVRYTVRTGQAADVLITSNLSDIRCRVGGSACVDGPLSDYTGDVEATSVMRITDKWNGFAPSGGAESATATDLSLPVTMPCTATAVSAGSNCSVSTSINALVPGAIKDSKRQIMQLADVQIMDGGPDGDVSTADNDLFATQGVFVP